MLNRKISIAPMMEYTDRHFRFFMRLLTKKTLLYTEMIHAGAIVYGDKQRFLAHNNSEHPLAIQLGGSDPKMLAAAAKLAEAAGYDEVNLNVGCPSPRVQSGAFGACLMKQPELVATLVESMRQEVTIPVTVKTRIGVDNLDSYDYLVDFLKTVNNAGCDALILHARKAWLSGLSPKENRTIPPLCYDTVYQLKKDFPAWNIFINGGIKTICDIYQHLQHTDGVMVGREACHNPFLFKTIDADFFNEPEAVSSRKDILSAYLPYVYQELDRGVPIRVVLKPLLGLYYGEPFARLWRKSLCDVKHKSSLSTLLDFDTEL